MMGVMHVEPYAWLVFIGLLVLGWLLVKDQ